MLCRMEIYVYRFCIHQWMIHKVENCHAKGGIRHKMLGEHYNYFLNTYYCERSPLKRIWLVTFDEPNAVRKKIRLYHVTMHQETLLTSYISSLRTF